MSTITLNSKSLFIQNGKLNINFYLKSLSMNSNKFGYKVGHYSLSANEVKQ